MVEKLKEMDIGKKISAFTSIFTIVVIIIFLLWIIKEHVNIDYFKASKYLNSKFFGSMLNLLVGFTAFFMFDSLYPGHTISTIMNINPTSSPEDKKNATYLMCTIFMGICWIISYQ